MRRSAEIHLSEEGRRRVQLFERRAKANKHTVTRARVLLKCDEGWANVEISEAFGVSNETIRNVRMSYLAGGIEAVLVEKRRTRWSQKLTDEQVAYLIAVAGSEVSEGHHHWTMRMLADKAVELGYVQQLSPETMRLLLKKSGEALATFKDVLVLYVQIYGFAALFFCFDEKPLVMYGEVRELLPCQARSSSASGSSWMRLTEIHL